MKNKYRIIETETSSGLRQFTVKERFLWFFWIKTSFYGVSTYIERYHEGWMYTSHPIFKSLEEAEKAINSHVFVTKELGFSIKKTLDGYYFIDSFRNWRFEGDKNNAVFKSLKACKDYIDIKYTRKKIKIHNYTPDDNKV